MFQRGIQLALSLFMLVGLFALPSIASAQATRTWVSGVGDDANPCSRTAPCKTFAGAISKTAADGEINCLDSGGFGAVTITKSIVIDCGYTGGVLNSGSHGIAINSATARVVLRNLTINGFGLGLNGINVLNAREVVVDNVMIRGQSQLGISFKPGVNASLVVTNSTVIENGSHGITAEPQPGFTASMTVSRSTVANNVGAGVKVKDGATGTVVDTTITSNGANGVIAASSVTAAAMHLERVISTFNGAGLASNGALTTVSVSNSVFAHNTGAGLQSTGGGQVVSHGGNRLVNNTGGSGTFTSTQSAL